MLAPVVDFTALKTRQQAAWGSGDYAVIGTTLQIVGELLAEACDLKTDERVLDVAAGDPRAICVADLEWSQERAEILEDCVNKLLAQAAKWRNRRTAA